MSAPRRLLTAALLLGPPPAAASDTDVDQRDRLLDQIVRDIQATTRDAGRGKLSDPCSAMRTVPSHRSAGERARC